MKRATRRAISICLVLAVCFSTSIMGFAAEVTWNDGTRPCVASAVKGAQYTLPVPIQSATIWDHEYGEPGLITWPMGYTATKAPTYNGSFPVADRMYIMQAMEAESVNLITMSCTLVDPYDEQDYYVLDPNLPSGEYSYGAEFEVYDVTWFVAKGNFMGRAIVGEQSNGTITGIPVSCTDSKLIVMSLDRSKL